MKSDSAIESPMTERAISVVHAIVGILVFIAVWQVGADSKQLLGFPLPWIGRLPAPSGVIETWSELIFNVGYWQSWYYSTLRVLGGFLVAMLIGIPFGLALSISKAFYALTFPSFEILRPIPPLAWVPAAIIFWPTQELSIGFIIFLGAFFTVVINVVQGAKSVDRRFVEAALSMGSSRWDIFRRIILPGTIPSIVVGATVGMGITWETVVAAEMISGGSSSMSGGSGATGGGLGFFIWNSYIGGSYDQIVVGMFSIGIAGYLCSGGIRLIGELFTPWLRRG